MDAIKFLIDQHRKLESELKTGLEAKQSNARSAALVRVGDDLTKHLTSEEEVFYPAVKAKGTEDVLLESLEEHLSLKRLLADLLTLDPEAGTWEAKFKVLQEQTEHHHKEEEENLFPKVRKMMDANQLDALGQDLLALQQRLQQAGAPRDAVVEQTAEAAPLK
ncbi:MAG: hemerythrin domain-containing protein [Burkholderiaceae bacterium]|nr:hemerythrin domain-containing protein [Burkholderiaceae bacterium]